MLDNPWALMFSVVDTSGSGVFDFGALPVAVIEGLTGGGTLALNSAATQGFALEVGNITLGRGTTYSGAMSGSGGLVVDNASTLTLGGSNSFTGVTYLWGSSASLVLANTAALAGSTLDTSGGGTLSFGTLTSAAFGSLQGTAGTLTLNNAATPPARVAVGRRQRAVRPRFRAFWPAAGR